MRDELATPSCSLPKKLFSFKCLTVRFWKGYLSMYPILGEGTAAAEHCTVERSDRSTTCNVSFLENDFTSLVTCVCILRPIEEGGEVRSVGRSVGQSYRSAAGRWVPSSNSTNSTAL